MSLLTREAILGADDLSAEEVAVPEWGGTVRVRSLTGLERDQLETEILAAKDGGGVGHIRARLAALTVCDAGGARLFTAEDLEALGQKSAAALDRVFAVASRLNGMTEKDVVDLGKGSAGAAPDSTDSSSPSASA